MADRYEIKDDGKLIQIGCPDGCLETLRPTEPDVGVYLDDIVIGAIRQQQADLAALTAERDQLRARLDAVDAAPTVATVCIAPTSDFPVLKYSRYDIPRINGTELIARPAKDGGT